MTEQRVRLLVVDDEESLRVPLKRYLERHFGYQVDPVASGPEALRSMEQAEGRYDVALIDEVLVGGLDGIETMQRIKARYPGVEVIIFTGWGAESKERALRAGAFRYLEKPVHYDELAMLIRTAAQQVRLRDIGGAILSERTLDRVLDGIVGAANSLALADEAAIVLLEKGSARLTVHPALAPMKPCWHRHFTNHRLSREIIETGQMVWVPDTTQDSRVNPEVVETGIYSFLGLPIPGDGGNLGVLYVYSSKSGRFEDWGTVSVLQTLAGQAGLALANAQAFQQIRSHASYMESLVEVARGLTRSSNLEEQLELAWAFVRKQLQVSTFVVALYDRDMETLRFPLVRDEERELEISDVSLAGDQVQWGITGHVVKTGQELFWSTSEAKQQQCESLGIRSIEVGKPCESCLYLPLRAGDKAIGAISIQSYERYAFDPIVLDAFRALGSHLTVALENTRLFEAEAQRRREAETLRETALALTSILEPEEIFERILSELQKVVPYDSASVQLLKEDRLEIIAGRGYPDVNRLLGFSFPLDGDSPNCEVVGRRDWFIVPDAPANYGAFSQEPHKQAGIRGWLGVPMLIGERLVGMLELDKRQPGFYTSEHARLAQSFAAQAAVTGENARLFSGLAEANEWRAALLQGAFDAVVAIDRNHKITVFNRRAEEIFGWDANEMIGNTVAELHQDLQMAQRIYAAVDEAGEVRDWRVDLKSRDGTPIPALLSATLIRDSLGQPIGQAGFLRDLRQVTLLEDQLRALIEVSRTVTSTLELDEVLEQVVTAAVSAFPDAEHGSLHLYDDRADVLRLRASMLSFSPEAIEASCLKPGEGVTGWVFEQQRPSVVADIQQDPHYKHFDHPEIPVHRSMMCVPLRVRERVIGTLSLDNSTRVGAFQVSDLALLYPFADQAAIAIDNARLYQEAKIGQERLRDFYGASSALVSSKDLGRVLKEIVEQARVAAHARSVSMILIDKTGQVRDLITAGPEQPVDQLEIIRPKGLSMAVMESGQPEIVEDAHVERARLNPSAFWQQIAAALCLPVTLEGERVGVVWFHYDEPHRFPRPEVEAMQLYVNQAALAYDSARRIKELEHIRQAAEALAGAADLDQVLERIVNSAREVLQADSAAIWSYDEIRDRFIPGSSVSAGIPAKVWHEFRQEEPRRGRTAYTVMEAGWIGVSDLDDKDRYDFLGDATRKLLHEIGVRSFQGITLLVGDEKLGVLYVNYNYRRSFHEREQEIAQTFANHVALALKKARLLEQLSDARDAAKVFAEVSTLEDLPCTLHSIVEGTLRALDCDAVTLFTYDPEREEFDFPPVMAGVWDETTIRRRDGMTGLSLVRNIMLLEGAHEAEDAQSDVLMQGPFVQREKVRSSMGMPLRVGGRPVGVMFVNYRSYHRFTADELTNIELFANQAAVAIRNAQLYQSKERHAQALRAIQDTSAAVSAVLDLSALLPMVTEKAADIFAAPATSLMLWDEAETQMVIRAAHGLGEEYVKRQRIKRETVDVLISAGGVVSQVFDISQNPIGIPELIASEGLCSVLATPLTIGGRLLGILNVYSRGEPRRFEEQEKELASVFANHAAIAIGNAQAYEELKRTKGLVGARTSLAWMGMVSTAWRHTVGNHAANIQLVLELIKRDLASEAPLAHMEERLKSISQAASKIQDTPITAPLQAEEGVVSVSVDMLLKERLQQRWRKEPFSSVELECDLGGDESLTVRTSPDWLRRAFDILVDNAVDAMAGSQTRRLSVSTRAEAGGIEVAVKDTGTGISEDVLPRVLKSAIPKPKGAKGLGVGLLMADTIVQAYGGKIRVGSTSRSGTTMILWLPQERGDP